MSAHLPGVTVLRPVPAPSRLCAPARSMAPAFDIAGPMRLGVIEALRLRQVAGGARRRQEVEEVVLESEVGGDVALYFDPKDPAELEQLLERLLGDASLRRDLSARGPLRAAQFRWDDAAEKTLAVLRQAAE